MKDWQKDQNQIITSNVQHWQNGQMVTARMSKQTARQMVANGEAFVISNQAIGAIVDGKKAS